MGLTDQQIAEFIAMYKVMFGRELTKSEALEKGTTLLNLIKTVLLENKRQEDALKNK